MHKGLDIFIRYVSVSINGSSACGNFTPCAQGNTQQALDVLNTGIAHQEGPGHDRLQLAMAEVHAANSNWVGMQPASTI